jgi:hypothetical protein
MRRRSGSLAGAVAWAWVYPLSRPRALSARGRLGQGRPAGAAARPGSARSWTRPPARAGWQPRGKGAGVSAPAGVVGWVEGPGVACPKSRCSGCEPAALEAEPFPRLPSRVLRRGGCGAPGVGLEAGEDGIADLPLQRAQRFLACLALGQFLLVVGAALAVPVADLGDRDHMDGVVEAAVAAPGQPVDLARARGYLDRRGAVVAAK